MAAIGTLNGLGIAEETCKDEADKHQHDEGDVGAVCNGAGGAVEVLPERDQRPNDSAHIEDHPEVCDVAALLSFGGI